MENGDAVVEEVSAPSLEEQMLESISEDEGSPPSSPEPEVRADESTDAEENVAAQEGIEEKTEESVPKKSFLKRINGLQAAKRKAEANAQQLESQLHEYHSVLETVKHRLDATEKRLAEYEETDPRDVELERLKQERQQIETRSKLDREASARQRKHKEQELVEERADQIIDQAAELSEKYQTFSSEELVILFSKVDDGDMKQMARKLNEQRVRQYKKVLATNGGGRVPSPIRPQGSASASTGNSRDEMVTFLESIGE
jgi:hypothetical protein